MNKLSLEEIKQYLIELEESEELEESVLDALAEEDEYYGETQAEIAKLTGPFTLVVDIGGGEGDGSTVERVLHFPESDIYVRFKGYYASNDGTTWQDIDQMKQVFPKEVMVTQYFTEEEAKA